MKLLIIEDDTNFAKLVARALEGLTESITMVQSWEEAYQKIDGQDAAWIDLRMPSSMEQESIIQIEALRKARPELIIIVGSGYIDNIVRAQLDRAGIDACYYKGGRYDPKQIASLVILGLMKATKRNPHSLDKLLAKALEWMSDRFPEPTPAT